MNQQQEQAFAQSWQLANKLFVERRLALYPKLVEALEEIESIVRNMEEVGGAGTWFLDELNQVLAKVAETKEGK